MTLDPKTDPAAGLRNFGGNVVADLDTVPADRADDTRTIEPTDEDYFAIPSTTNGAHGSASPSPAQGSPGAGSSTAAKYPAWESTLNDALSSSHTTTPAAPAQPTTPTDDAGNDNGDPFAGLLALTDAKSWTQSRTIQAIVGMAITGIANKLGAHLDNGTISDLVGYVTEIAFAAFSIWAVISRIRATHRIATPAMTAIGGPATKVVAIAACLLVAGGCATATPQFVRSERAIQQSVSPTLAGLIDGTLPLDEVDADERESIHNTLDLWDANLRHAEQATTQPTIAPVLASPAVK